MAEGSTLYSVGGKCPYRPHFMAEGSTLYSVDGKCPYRPHFMAEGGTLYSVGGNCPYRPHFMTEGSTLREFDARFQKENWEIFFDGCVIWQMLITSPQRGLRGIVFTLCVCLSVCLSGQYFGILFLGYR